MTGKHNIGKPVCLHGEKPYRVALVHGGPGAAGEMASLALLLKDRRGVLEPWQTESTLEGQVLELGASLKEMGALPMVLVGFSWGAWLSLIYTARFPEVISKLILVGCPPLDECYVKGIEEKRLARLSSEQKQEASRLSQLLADPKCPDRDRLFGHFGELFSSTDDFDPIASEEGEIDFRADIYSGVWPEASQLRKNGGLLELAKRLACPVVAIHGDYDPHPAEGVQAPLASILGDFRFVLLKKCGHKPWMERQAREDFLELLEQELT